MATALLEKQGAAESLNDVALRLWTVDTLYQALNAGLLEDPKRLELVHGRIIQKMPQNPVHTFLRRRLSQFLRDSMTPRFLVMEESPLRLAIDGEPVPNVLVVGSLEEDYRETHPTQAETVLVVEVSNTTAEYDLGEKAMLYAQSGIADYWVIRVNDSAIVVHRQPSPEGYQDVVRLAGMNTISPLALPEAGWTVDALLGRNDI